MFLQPSFNLQFQAVFQTIVYFFNLQLQWLYNCFNNILFLNAQLGDERCKTWRKGTIMQGLRAAGCHMHCCRLCVWPVCLCVSVCTGFSLICDPNGSRQAGSPAQVQLLLRTGWPWHGTRGVGVREGGGGSWGSAMLAAAQLFEVIPCRDHKQGKSRPTMWNSCAVTQEL